jgi:hypothetical protein
VPLRHVAGGQLPAGQLIDRESLNDALTLDENRKQDQYFATTVCEKKAEVIVAKRFLELKMMNKAIQMF